MLKVCCLERLFKSGRGGSDAVASRLVSLANSVRRTPHSRTPAAAVVVNTATSRYCQAAGGSAATVHQGGQTSSVLGSSYNPTRAAPMKTSKVATVLFAAALATSGSKAKCLALAVNDPFGAQQIEAQFGIAVVDESIQQREYRLPEGAALQDGPLILPPPHAADRHARAELLLVWTPIDGWITRRRMISVNRDSAPSASEPSFESLVARGAAHTVEAVADMRLPAPVLRTASFIPVVDYPIWAWAMLDDSERRRTGLTDASITTSTNQINIRGRNADTDIRIELKRDPDGRMKRADVTAQAPTASLNVTIDYDSARFFLPKKMSERYRSGLEVISTEIVYSHVRRFSSSGARLDEHQSDRR